jgi:hypothetical protein
MEKSNMLGGERALRDTDRTDGSLDHRTRGAAGLRGQKNTAKAKRVGSTKVGALPTATV